jgi:hypothetical protein
MEPSVVEAFAVIRDSARCTAQDALFSWVDVLSFRQHVLQGWLRDRAADELLVPKQVCLFTMTVHKALDKFGITRM